MLIIARTTGVQTTVMNGKGNARHHMIVSWYKERENRKVSSRCLKTASDFAEATWRGRSFQAVATETGNARLPTVERRTGGTSRRRVAEDRSRRLDVMSETRVKVYPHSAAN